MNILNINKTLVMAAAAIIMSACSGKSDPDPGTGGEQPVVSLTVGSATTSTLAFTVTSSNAGKAAYICVEKGSSMPNIGDIFQNGTSVEPNTSAECVAEGLKSNTEYVLIAAAASSDGKSMVSSIPETMKTLDPAEVDKAKPGDFYYSDGTWSTELDPKKTPIAIVFYSGVATEMADASSFYKTKDGKSALGDIHGYAVALNDATYYDGTNHTVWWSFFDGNYPGTASKETTDFLGYSNTQGIVSMAFSEYHGLTAENDNFPATYYATVAYEKACPAPDKSSGWFLPSAYQFKYIYDNVYFNPQGTLNAWLEKSFEKLGDKAMPLYAADAEYWTSTEKYDSNGLSYWAYYYSFDDRQANPGFIASYRKNVGFRVRSMIVF